jgi:hypothetical protein
LIYQRTTGMLPIPKASRPFFRKVPLMITLRTYTRN